MNAFEEFMFGDTYVLRFYRVDHGLVCTINESMVSELREVESKLRQQQTEIEALKMQIVTKLANQNNEAVALMTSFGIHPLFEGALQEGQFLYTHPAKTLTDEEIYEVWHDLYERWEEEDTLKFARAILRKAQEK